MDVLPSLNGSQAKPMTGAKFLLFSPRTLFPKGEFFPAWIIPLNGSQVPVQARRLPLASTPTALAGSYALGSKLFKRLLASYGCLKSEYRKPIFTVRFGLKR